MAVTLGTLKPLTMDAFIPEVWSQAVRDSYLPFPVAQWSGRVRINRPSQPKPELLTWRPYRPEYRKFEAP